uniref:Uncharacterized protein n=1 Tax=Methylophaga nitratireducenticrescens TaxID=754476 RepID=I1XKK7_METNJ
MLKLTRSINKVTKIIISKLMVLVDVSKKKSEQDCMGDAGDKWIYELSC